MCHIANAFCDQLKRLVETYKSTHVRVHCNVGTVHFIIYNMIMYLNTSYADLSSYILFFSPFNNIPKYHAIHEINTVKKQRQRLYFLYYSS